MQAGGLTTLLVHEGASLEVTVLAAPVLLPGVGGGAPLSADPGNQAVLGADGGVYVPAPEPVQWDSTNW